MPAIGTFDSSARLKTSAEARTAGPERPSSSGDQRRPEHPERSAAESVGGIVVDEFLDEAVHDAQAVPVRRDGRRVAAARDRAGRAGRRERLDEVPHIACAVDGVRRGDEERRLRARRERAHDRVGGAERAGLADEAHLEPEARAVADEPLDLFCEIERSPPCLYFSLKLFVGPSTNFI